MLKAVETYVRKVVQGISADPVMIAILIVAAVTAIMWFNNRRRRENIDYTNSVQPRTMMSEKMGVEVAMHCKVHGNYRDFDKKAEYKNVWRNDIWEKCKYGKSLAEKDASKNAKVTEDRCPSKKKCPVAETAKRYPCLSMDGTKCVGKRDEKKFALLTEASRNEKESKESAARIAEAKANKTYLGSEGNKASVWQGCTYYTRTLYSKNPDVWGCAKSQPKSTGVAEATGADFSSIRQYQCTQNDACKKKVTDEVDRLKKAAQPPGVPKPDCPGGQQAKCSFTNPGVSGCSAWVCM